MGKWFGVAALGAALLVVFLHVRTVDHLRTVALEGGRRGGDELHAGPKRADGGPKTSALNLPEALAIAKGVPGGGGSGQGQEGGGGHKEEFGAEQRGLQAPRKQWPAVLPNTGRSKGVCEQRG